MTFDFYLMERPTTRVVYVLVVCPKCLRRFYVLPGPRSVSLHMPLPELVDGASGDSLATIREHVCNESVVVSYRPIDIGS